MKFYEVLTQVIGRLVLEGRVTYRALQRDFDLDDALLADLREELIVAKQLALDEDGRVLVWRGQTRLSGPSEEALPPVLYRIWDECACVYPASNAPTCGSADTSTA